MNLFIVEIKVIEENVNGFQVVDDTNNWRSKWIVPLNQGEERIENYVEINNKKQDTKSREEEEEDENTG